MCSQAVANGLSLPLMPSKLAYSTEMECPFIRLLILSMKIISHHKAWSHIEINGPCISVPATLKYVCQMSPQIPDEAQIVPIKLK